MKKKILGLIFPVLGAVFLGFVSGRVVYKIYRSDIENELRSSKLYLIQGGEYLTYDNMREENNSNNYVYFKDNQFYKTVVGITKDKSNIEKIKNLYSNTTKVNEFYISSDILSDKQEEYDKALANTNDIHEVKEVVDNILNLYRSDDDIKLILVK